MKEVYLIDESIDKMGGVERVVNTVANSIYRDYKFSVISLTKNRKETFFKYDKDINIKYLLDASNFKARTIKEKNFFYYFYRTCEKIIEHIIYGKFEKEFCKNISDDSVIIFGRVQISFGFFKYLKKYNKHPNIIIRDAVNLSCYRSWVKRKMLKFFPEYVNTFIVSSDESINEYKDFFNNNINKMRIEKIYNPLGIVPRKCGNYENKKVVSIGRMDNDQKGFRILIKAFKKVSKLYPDWKLELYGNGVLKEDYIKLVNELELNENITINSGTQNVVDVFEKSSIFVLASRHEGYANILVEAMACGMPCITFNWLNGANDIVNNNVNGMMINLKDRKRHFDGFDDDDDIENLSNAIIELISNRQLMEDFSNEAIKINSTRNRMLIIEKWKKIINQTHNILNFD